MASLEANLDELQFDLNNPRFDRLNNEREALEKIVSSQGSKLVNLAEDIVNEGMSPAHRMLVMRSPGKGDTGHIVMDGNRRLAALKILTNPSALDGMNGVGDVTKQKLRKLAKEFDLSEVQPLDVFVCKDEAQARHWIEAIHTGENEGRGVVSWDGIATARYRGKNASLKVLDFVKATGKLTEDEASQLERFPITTLDRLLGTPEIRERLGLALENGDLLSDLPQSELVRPLKKIVLDLAQKKITVSHLKKKDDRTSYVESLNKVLPDLSKRTGSAVPLDRISAHAQAASHHKPGANAQARSLLGRKALIPPQSQCHLNITNEKLQQICKELRKLPLETYPITIAAVFRVFLELSLDHYGTEKRVAGYSTDGKLKDKIEKIAADLIANGVNKRDLQEFRSLASNRNKVLSIDRLHGVIHSRYSLPTPNELRSGWAEVEVAFTRIWA